MTKRQKPPASATTEVIQALWHEIWQRVIAHYGACPYGFQYSSGGVVDLNKFMLCRNVNRKLWTILDANDNLVGEFSLQCDQLPVIYFEVPPSMTVVVLRVTDEDPNKFIAGAAKLFIRSLEMTYKYDAD